MIAVKNMVKTRNLQQLITAGAMALALQWTPAMGQTTSADLVTVPPVPTNIQVPPGHKPFLKGSAVGTQNYICLPSGWTFLAPQATLFLTFRLFNNEVRQQVTTHFLSPNPAEGGTGRATWQSSFDTSSVWARAIANSTDPNFVDPNAIPWLLLEPVGTQRGPTGGTTLSQTTFIQRITTRGGLIPTKPCSVGNIEFVPYTADYFFYKSDK
jgi:hypothetical protein